MSDITHQLFIENVNEENQKKNDISDSIFQLNSKKNLISVAKETLKSRNNKFNKIKLKNPVVKTEQNEISPKKKFKSTKKKNKEKEDVKSNLIFSDKDYLNFMLNDLKLISSSLEKQQKRFNPTYPDNSFRINNKFISYNKNNKKRNNRKVYNYKKENNLRKQNYTNINLLNQIIGIPDEYEPNFVNKAAVTEDNIDFNNLFFENTTNEIIYEENMNN